MLDAYASAMVNAARMEPDGMGCIAEDDARLGCFQMPEDERIKDKEQERLLLIATVEDLLRHEIALREQSEEAMYLVFPSQLTRENPDLPDPSGKAVIITFEGPVLTVYATLAVRLSHSGVFRKKELWKNAATYTDLVGGLCGFYAREIEEGRAEFALFFDAMASEQTRYQFEEYILTHLRRRALPGSIQRRRIFTCLKCNTPVSDVVAIRRRERGYDWLECPVCDSHVLLLDGKERLGVTPQSIVQQIDRAADVQRDREAANFVSASKIATRDYDVFLCHNSKDKPVVKEIANQLKQRDILPWLDEWELRPGIPWQSELERQIENIKAVAVFVGQDGIGPWQNMELESFLLEFVKRKCPVIPVILLSCENPPKLPIFLSRMTWVDFRKRDPDPLERLVWGITGERRPRREPET